MSTRTLDPRLLAVLACPEDKGPLYYLSDDEGLLNPRLHRRYHVREGIPVMLIDEAESLTAEQTAELMAAANERGVEPTFTI
jgi:uncharacterized protein